MVNQSDSIDRMEHLERFSVFHVKHDAPRYVAVDFITAESEYLADIAARQLFHDSTIIRIERDTTTDTDEDMQDDMGDAYPGARFINGEFRVATFCDENILENDK